MSTLTSATAKHFVILLALLSGCKKESTSTGTTDVDTSIVSQSIDKAIDSSPRAATFPQPIIPDSLAHIVALADSLDSAWQLIENASTPRIKGFQKFPEELAIMSRRDSNKTVLFYADSDVDCAGDTSGMAIYSNGNFYRGKLSDPEYFLADSFDLGFHNLHETHPKGLAIQSGMTESEVESLLGIPAHRGPGIMSYAQKEYSADESYAEILILYFQDGRLRYARLKTPHIC